MIKSPGLIDIADKNSFDRRAMIKSPGFIDIGDKNFFDRRAKMLARIARGS